MSFYLVATVSTFAALWITWHLAAIRAELDTKP